MTRFKVCWQPTADVYCCWLGGRVGEGAARYQEYATRFTEHERDGGQFPRAPTRNFNWGGYHWSKGDTGWAVVPDYEPETNEWGEVAP